MKTEIEETFSLSKIKIKKEAFQKNDNWLTLYPRFAKLIETK